MEPVELLLGLLAAIAVVVALAPWTRVPHPILLVVIGTGIGLVPGLPRVELDPDLTLLVFLPPLLYWLAGVGGTLVGVAAGWGGHQVLRRVREPPVENMVNLLIPFAAYLAAERIGASGVLSVLACGLWMSQHSRDAITSAGRVAQLRSRPAPR